jgi:aminopeptidase-like protein
MLDVVRELAPLRRAICAPDYDRAAARLGELLPFTLHDYRASGRNGWVIPPRWEATAATISRAGRLVYDGLAHPLGVITLSAPFEGRVALEALRAHLHFHRDDPEAIPFHYRQQFRSWARDWGFCLPRRLYDSLAPGDYDVVIRTRESRGRLRVLEHTHPGRRDELIVIAADLDRPGIANDGPAACAVGIEVMRRLRGRRTKLGYRLVLVPGTIGSEYYLARLPARERGRLFEGVFLEMLGTPTRLALQRSRDGRSAVEAALARSLRARGADHRVGDFESILINDEWVWEAHGVPMCSLSRFPYPEYHGSRDNAEAMSEAALEEAAGALEGAIDEMESSPLVTRRFTGALCLSNPVYDLFVDPGETVLGNRPGEDAVRLRRLMDLIPALTRPATLRGLAERVGLGEDEVGGYLARWAAKGLLEID